MNARTRAVVSGYLLIAIVGTAFAQAGPDPRPGPSTPVTVVNTNAIPVAVPGGVTVSGGVSITNTPNVNVANTPSVTVANTPMVQSVQTGTWNVGLTGPVSLSSGTTVMVVPGSPAQPYFYTDDEGGGSVVGGYHVQRVFGPAAPNARLALTSAIFANASNREWFIKTVRDDCNGGNSKLYLEPLVQVGTFAVTFPSPLVITSTNAWCLNVLIPADGALYPFTLVGYAM